MSNRIKSNSLKTREQFNAAVDAAANFDVTIRYINARRDRAIQRIQLKFGMKTAPLELQRDAQAALAAEYAEAHRKELLPDEKKKKSADTAGATFGWRTGNRTVRTASKKFTEETVIEALKEQGLGTYVATVETIAKARILQDAGDDDTTLQRDLRDEEGQLVAKDGVQQKEAVTLATVGLKITQAESFFIEPKVETAEAIKTEQAA